MPPAGLEPATRSSPDPPAPPGFWGTAENKESAVSRDSSMFFEQEFRRLNRTGEMYRRAAIVFQGKFLTRAAPAMSPPWTNGHKKQNQATPTHGFSKNAGRRPLRGQIPPSYKYYYRSPILARLVPLKSAHNQFSNDTDLVKVGAILRELQRSNSSCGSPRLLAVAPCSL